MSARMKNIGRWILLHQKWVPVAGGIIYFALWCIGEAGRYPLPLPVFALFAVAIALSGWTPSISLGIIVALPIAHLFDAMYPPTATNWASYLACGFVALVVGFTGEGLVRRLVIPVGFIVSGLFALRLSTRSTEGWWSSWVGIDQNLGVQFAVDAFAALLIGALIVYFGLWAVGFALRSLLRVKAIGHALGETEGRLQDTDFELRLSQDRARISRDVHDALAHSLAVIVSQAEGALALSAQKPKVAGEALGNIVSVARTALGDVRGLVERIHDHDVTVPSPRIDDLGDLIDHLRSIGTDVTFRVLGERVPLPDSHELAVFRIVQESLTNALKHTEGPVTANVTLDWQGPGLAVLVASRGVTRTEASGRGVGIEGMKERARLAGGWLTAAPADDDFFIVTGYIPTASVGVHV